MKYFLIAGEASGDLHGANLMKAIKQEDPEASFRFYGGDMMSSVGGTRLCHYRKLAYMGFLPVLAHLPQILWGMHRCKREIANWKPDAVILIDYPGFNLQIARYVHLRKICPVYYYIGPKIWAWKEGRIKSIRAYVDRLFSILPFEVEFYEKKHNYPISYVGNPTADEIAAFNAEYHETKEAFCLRHGLDPQKGIIALLPGSRRVEVIRNLAIMCRGVGRFFDKGYQVVIGATSALPASLYTKILAHLPKNLRGKYVVVTNETFPLLSHSTVATIVSGTAVLEGVLMGVPLVAVYKTPFGRLLKWMQEHILQVEWVTLPNLISKKLVVSELVAGDTRDYLIDEFLDEMLPGNLLYDEQVAEYKRVWDRLGPIGAAEHAAREMVGRIKGEWKEA